MINNSMGDGDVHAVIPSLDLMFAVFNLCVGISSIVMNFIVFTVYIKLNWKHPTYFLFINITLHDAVSGFTGIYMGVFFLYHRPDSLGPGVNVLCKLNGLLWSLTAFTTPTLLCLASAIRFMAIYMPYSYKDWVNIKNAIIGVAVGWLVGVFSTLVPIFSGNSYKYEKYRSVCDVDFISVQVTIMVVFILVPLLVPLLVLMLCNAAVLVHLCKQTRRSSDSSAARNVTRPEGSVQLPTSLEKDEFISEETHQYVVHLQPASQSSRVPQFGNVCEWKQRGAKKDYHTATTVIIMTLNYVFCYGLWIVYFTYRILSKSEFSGSGAIWGHINDSGVIYVDATIKLMACMNSALNGIVHIVRSSRIRCKITSLVSRAVGWLC